MVEISSFRTIRSAAVAAELRIKGSRFLAEIHPAGTKESIEGHLSDVRKRHHSATHHCFAYRLRPNADLIRAADDGEPTGTAGRPILFVLTSAQLTNVLLIVTRYFGGVKLGTGGLARAYTEAAQRAVAAAEIIQIHITEEVELSLGYADVPQLEHLLSRQHVEVVDRSFAEDITFRIAIRVDQVAGFLDELSVQFSGRINCRRQLHSLE